MQLMKRFSTQSHHGLMITFGVKVVNREITIEDKNEVSEVK
ncbi:hypothetical protein [Bacillus cereus]|nr:hypothetical protein [Bacillus cereus]